MYERFTDAARRNMMNANRKAERYGHKYVGSLHILIAILDTESSIFDAPWINVTHLRATAAEIVSRTPCGGAKQAIENALALAAKYESGVVDIPHIVLGIFTAPDASVSPKARIDAFHISMAAVHGIQFLLTWNCKHIANPENRPNIERACRHRGIEPPLICTPYDLLEI